MQSEYINEDYSVSFDPPSPTRFEFSQTSSYNNSYNNSPFSANSELSFGDNDESFGLFTENYNPDDYGESGPSLLMFPDTEYFDPRLSMHGDYSSPSDNGDDQQQLRSRASSVSSQHHLTPDVAHSFENLTFHSPNWNNQPLPHLRSGSPHPQKPQSPPRLLMPDPDQSNSIAPPTINAPDGDGDNAAGAGPKLRIVPATPVSGGGIGGGNQVMPFMRGASNLQAPSSWEQQPQPQPPQTQDLPHTPPSSSSVHTSPSPSQPFTFPARDTPNTSDGSGSAPPTGNNGFLVPNVPSRSRSKSDPPVWDPRGDDYMNDSATVNMHDVTPSLNNNNQFLSPELGPLRRSKSETRHHRQSRSEDYRSVSPNAQLLTVPGMGFNGGNIGINTSSQFLTNDGMYLSPQEPPPSIRSHHGHSQSLSVGMGANSLGLGFHTPSPPPPQHQGHYRRASSGSRSERGTSASWAGEPLGYSGPSSSNASTVRKSPYPSPNASPRPRYDDLPREDPLEGLGITMPPHGMSPNMAPAQLPTKPPQMVTVGGTSIPLNVAKQNVTTGRTKKASHNRRKQEATFVCPVPGCGSTFTRSFNLKGHIRSHNEEKPFLCHWPGCGKGFARQHDCKRHEQLHTNYRPFTCEGCNKPFARMDALNRHLRSEGGAECQRTLEANGTLPPGVGSSSNNSSSSNTQSKRNPSPSSRRYSRSNSNAEAQSPPANLPIPINIPHGGWPPQVGMEMDGAGSWGVPKTEDTTWSGIGLGVTL